MRTLSNSAQIARVTIPESRREEIRAAVIAGLSRGTPLTVVLEVLGCPMRTFENWRVAREDVAEAVLAARDLGYDWIAHECMAIVDDTEGDVIYDADGNAHANGANVLRAKLRVETRLKLLAKWDPRRYGDTKRVEVDAHVSTTTRHVVDSRTLTEAGRDALRRLLAEAQAKGLLAPPDADDPSVMDAIETEYHDVTSEAAGDDETEPDD